MRSRNRNITVFSISALDLFAAALGAFILIVLVLFPYYRLGGTDTSMEELEEMVETRRLVASSTQSEMAEIRAIQAEIRLLDAQYRTTAENMSETEARIREVQQQTADIEIPDPPPVPEPVPEPEPIPNPPRSTGRGVEFSILGIGTQKKDVMIVVDMSGSMQSHTRNVVSALEEILRQMKPDNRFAILGYRGGPSYSVYPPGGSLARASRGEIDGALSFVNRLPRQFGGGTPTQSALIRALNVQPGAIILISDGQPDDGNPGNIVRNITRRNRGRAEIHTVAIGDYTSDPALTLFLQELANNNRGDFVGRAR
ncbi:VWA domain-containing protein [uncultured Algimonas sp.]|uniref:vWA domain-containing protein n=1 Tax=uncultured Algimonas sp. TaxID=1547920 RepID=UPI0026246565|nr:VWA domain-containing protein [uncultured Algimonas sp.]